MLNTFTSVVIALLAVLAAAVLGLTPTRRTLLVLGGIVVTSMVGVRLRRLGLSEPVQAAIMSMLSWLVLTAVLPYRGWRTWVAIPVAGLLGGLGAAYAPVDRPVFQAVGVALMIAIPVATVVAYYWKREAEE